MKREIPLIITAIAGLVFAISFFVPHYPFGRSESLFGDWISIVQAFAIWLGMLNLAKVSLEKIFRKSADARYAVIILASMLAMLIIGFSTGIAGLLNEPVTSYRATGTGFKWMYDTVYTPLSSTMFSMLAFFVASASYRAFRARNLESTLLLVTAFFVMAGRVPLIDPAIYALGLTEVPIFSHFSEWIMDIPNTAGQRAILIGIALGTMSSSLRVILGIERSHIGGD